MALNRLSPQHRQPFLDCKGQSCNIELLALVAATAEVLLLLCVSRVPAIGLSLMKDPPPWRRCVAKLQSCGLKVLGRLRAEPPVRLPPGWRTASGISTAGASTWTRGLLCRDDRNFGGRKVRPVPCSSKCS